MSYQPIITTDRELKNPVCGVFDTIRYEGDSSATYEFFIGENYPYWFMHANGKNILITYGDQKINLGKLIYEVTPFQITGIDGLNHLYISEFILEYRREYDHPIALATFKCNLEMCKRLWGGIK